MATIEQARKKWQHIGSRTAEGSITPSMLDEAGQQTLNAIESAVPQVGGSGNWVINGQDSGVKATYPLLQDAGDREDAAMSQRACTALFALKTQPPKPDVADVTLSSEHPTYAPEDGGPQHVSIWARDEGCSVSLPELSASKQVNFTIREGSKNITIKGVSYPALLTVFCRYNRVRNEWTVTNTLTNNIVNLPVDADNVRVKKMLSENAPITQIEGLFYEHPGVSGLLPGELIFLSAQNSKSEIGVYSYVSGNTIQRVFSGTQLDVVRVDQGGVFYSQYDGKNLDSLRFIQIPGSVNLDSMLLKIAQNLSQEEKAQVLVNLGMTEEVAYLRRQIARSVKKQTTSSNDNHLNISLNVDRQRHVNTSASTSSGTLIASFVPDHDTQTLVTYVNNTDTTKTLVIPNGSSKWFGEKTINYTWINLTDDAKIVVDPGKDVEIICVVEKLPDASNGEGNVELRITAKPRTI